MNDLDFLRFADYLEKKEHENNEWVTILRHDDYELNDGSTRSGSWSTICALVIDDKEVISELAKTTDWEVDWQFIEDGIIRKHESFQQKTNEWKDICEFKPLVYDNYRLASDFIKHCGLVLDENTGKYTNISDGVVAILDSCGLKIRVSVLRKYLKEKNLALIRYHEHKRRMNKPTLEILGDEPQEKTISDEKKLYRIHVGSVDATSTSTYSMLRGKDILRGN